MFDADLKEHIAATIATRNLVRTKRTWGDLSDDEKASYFSTAEEIERVIGTHLEVEYGAAKTNDQGEALRTEMTTHRWSDEAIAAAVPGGVVVERRVTPWEVAYNAEEAVNLRLLAEPLPRLDED